MSTEASGLPQAVIDEMFDKQATGKDTALPEASAAFVPDGVSEPAAGGSATDTQPLPQAETETPDTVAPPPAQHTLDEGALETMRQTMAELTQRTAELTAHLERLQKKQDEAVDYGAAVLQFEEKLEAAARHLREMEGRVTTVYRKLQGTPSYGVREDFTCESCGAHGLTAIPLRCTSCGKEGWWGWWPSHKE